MTEERIYLNCPFDNKDECKSLGGKWDGDAKKWYITGEMDSDPFTQWLDGSGSNPGSEKGEPAISSEKTYLNCPFEDKDECKSLGGKWDGDAKKWYIPAGNDVSVFAKRL